MSEVNDNDEVNNDEVDNENSQVLEILPPRNNDKVEGEEQEEEQDLMLSESVEKTSESGASLNKMNFHLIHDNDSNNSVQQYVEGLEEDEKEEEEEKLNNLNNPSKVPEFDFGESKSRHKLCKCCPGGCCELVARRRDRTDKLMKRQAEISTRLAMLEWLPTVTLNRIMQNEFDPRSVIKYIEKQTAIMSPVTKQSMRHGTQDCGCLAGERKEALRKHEEARRVLHEKQLQLKKIDEQIEDTRRKQEELQLRIYEAKRNNEENRDMVDDSESEYSFGLYDFENLTRLEELERREAAYIEILKNSELWNAKKDLDGEGNGLDSNADVDKLRGQLAAKSSANQQLADRICQLEDQIETLESKLRNCNHKIIEFSERQKQEEDKAAKLREKMKTTNGTGDSEISVRDKTTPGKVITTDRSSTTGSGRKIRSSFDGKITKEKSVNAVVGTSSKNTYTRIEVTDRAVQDPIPGNMSLGRSITGEKSIGNKKMSIEKTYSYTSSKSFEEDGKLQENLKGETGEETVERITTFDEAQTSGKTLLSRADNESSQVGVDSSRRYDETLPDNSPSLDDNHTGEMDTGSSNGKRPSTHSSKNEKLEAKVVSGNPESLLDDSTASKSAHLDLSAIPELENHKSRSSNDQSTQYEMELPFGGSKNDDINPDIFDDHDSINKQARDQSSQYGSERFGADKSDGRSGSGDKSFVSLKSRLSKDETNFDISGVPDDTNVQSRDQSKHSSVRFEADKSKSPAKNSERSFSGDKSFVSLKSQLSKDETNYDISGVPDIVDQSHDQSKHSSVRYEADKIKSPAKNSERSFSGDKSFVSLKSQLSKDETNYDISGITDDVNERARDQSKHSSVRFEETHKSDERSISGNKSFKSMKSQLSKELTNYEFSDVEDHQNLQSTNAGNERSPIKSFVSLKSQLSKEETDYGGEHGASGQEPAVIVVQRNELESWLKSLDATHSVISKCKECNIKKPEVIEIIEAIQRYLGIGSVSGVTKTTDQANQIQMRRADYYPNQDLMTEEKRSLIKKRTTKPHNLELRQQESIGEEEEMRMIKEHIGVPSGTSTPIDKESKQTTQFLKDNDGIDLPRSIQYSVPRQPSSDIRDAIRSESINARSIGSGINTLGGNSVLSHIQIQVTAPDDEDKPSDKHFKTTTDTITSLTMDKVDRDRRDVGTLVTPPLVDELQSHEPDAPLLLNENTQRQKHQNRDETNSSGAASIVLPSTVDIISNPQGITTTTTTTTTKATATKATDTATSYDTGANTATATASTSTSNLSVRGEGKTRSKGHGKVLTAYPPPEGEIFQDIHKPSGSTGRYGTKMNSSESTRALSIRSGDVNRKIDESRAWRNRDKGRKDDHKTEGLWEMRERDKEDPEDEERKQKLFEDKLRKGMKIYENRETRMKEFDGLSDTDGDKKKLIKNPSDKQPITAGQAHALDRRLSSDFPEITCCICHQTRQGKKLTKSQYEELVAGAGPTRVCLIESTSEFSDQQTQSSHKTKPLKSSPRKTEATTQTDIVRHQKPKGYPDFSCEVCDCDPCGTGGSLLSSARNLFKNKSKSGPSSPRSDEDRTRTRPRSTSGRSKR